MAARGRSLDGSWQGVSDPVSSQEHPGPRRPMPGPGRHAWRDRERGPPLAYHERLPHLRLAGSRKRRRERCSPPGPRERPCRVRPARRPRWPPRTGGWTDRATGVPRRRSTAKAVPAARGTGRPSRAGPARGGPRESRPGVWMPPRRALSAALRAATETGPPGHAIRRLQSPPVPPPACLAPSGRSRRRRAAPGAPANRRAPFHRATRGTPGPAWRTDPAAARQARQSTRRGACEACAPAPRRTGPRRPRRSAGSGRPVQAAPTAAPRAGGSAQGVSARQRPSRWVPAPIAPARRRAPSRSAPSRAHPTETARPADAQATAGRDTEDGTRRPSRSTTSIDRPSCRPTFDSAPVRRRNARASS